MYEAEINGKRIQDVLFNLNDRNNMDHQLLVGQNILEKGKFLIDPTIQEDEEVIQFALDNLNIKLETVNTVGDPGLTEFHGTNFDKSMKRCRRLWPHKTNTIGFFMAKLKKC